MAEAKKKKRKMSPASLANLKPQWKKGETGGGRRPKNRLKGLIKEAIDEIVKEGKTGSFEDLTTDEVNTADKFILSAPIALVQGIAKNDKMPLYIKAQAISAIMEMRDGKTTTVDKLRDHIYGAVKQQVDITTAGAPLGNSSTLTPAEATALIAKLNDEC